MTHRNDLLTRNGTDGERGQCRCPVIARPPWLTSTPRPTACLRCGLDEHLPLSQELAFHGPRELVWVVAEELAADCPQNDERRPCEICGVHCPSLAQFLA